MAKAKPAWEQRSHAGFAAFEIAAFRRFNPAQYTESAIQLFTSVASDWESASSKDR